MRAALPFLLFCAVSCGPQEPDDADDNTAIDYDAMNAKALGPPAPIDLQSFDVEEIEAPEASPYCLLIDPETRRLLFFATTSDAMVKYDGALRRLAPVPSLQRLPYDINTSFDGLEHSVKLILPDSNSTITNAGTLIRATLSIRDPHDRIVMNRELAIQCSDNGRPVIRP